MNSVQRFAGKTIVVRIDDSPLLERTTLDDDLAFLLRSDVHPIVVASTGEAARSYVRTLNRRANVAVGLSGADGALLPAGSSGVGRVQTGILATLAAAGYIPVIEPTALGLAGNDVELGADDVAGAIASATEAARVIFFHCSGGLTDPTTREQIAELTPAEALVLAEDANLDPELGQAVRAAALAVRAGVAAAQIFDGRVAHATIVEFLTAQHLGTQVTGAIYLGDAA
jgi:acetylglutamate kinase